ncbi:MAG: hypothetical protein HYR74_08985 [Candidatus Eisenbacteria bacterium]|nr:hypothetical protein [Candidatus Eisenbacteria bacterium]
MRGVIAWLRRVLVGDPHALAREALSHVVSSEDKLLGRFRREFRVPRTGEFPFVGFGTVPGATGGRANVGVPLEKLQTHVLDSGPTGSGKTRLALAVGRQLIGIPNVRTWSIDPKGDLTDGRERLIAEAMVGPLGKKILERTRLVSLFDRRAPAPLRLTAREPGIPIEVQAASLGTALAEASGADIGHRMDYILRWLAELAIETEAPLTLVLNWIARPATFASAAAQSANERLRHFARVEFPRENRESIRALRARLEGVLLLPSVRQCLEAPSCFDFKEALENYDVLVDASKPPAGEEAAVRVLCGPIFGRITRAILNRPVTAESPQIVCFIDELPEVLGRFEATGVTRLVSLSRSKRVGFFLIHQERGPLGAELFNSLRTNCGIETVFRPSRRDAALMAHALPVPEGVDDAGKRRAQLLRRLTRLPRREYALWIKDGAVPLHFVRAAHLDLSHLPDPSEIRHLLCPPSAPGQAAAGPVTQTRAESAKDAADSTQERDEPLDPGEFPALG